MDADTFGMNSGFDAEYPFAVSAGVDLTSLRMVVEQPNLWQLTLNGQIIKAIPGEWAIDKTFGVFDISEQVRIGENRLGIHMHPMSIYAELEPVYLLGEFDLKPAAQGWIVIPVSDLTPGFWKDQGMPFYAYDVAYEAVVNLQVNEFVKVRLPEWTGSVAEVFVNDASAGIIGWPPYECDISRLVKNGENHIKVVVTASLKNLLGPHHYVQHRGIVTPWSFKYAPKQQPAGAEYDLLDYGLFKPFVIETGN